MGRLLGLALLVVCFFWEPSLSSLFLGEEEIAALHAWLAAAYVEGEEFAGFGDLGSEAFLTPNLYATFGAVHSLFFLEEEIEGVEKNWEMDKFFIR